MTLNLQRIAWAVMLISFLLFCGFCTFSVYGVYSFLFDSTMPLTAVAQASRNSIGITGIDLREDVERGARALPIGNIVRPTDTDAQGVITIQDPLLDNAFIASLTLFGDSTALFRTALRPRFDLGTQFDIGVQHYSIEFSRASGAFEVLIADNLPRDLTFSIYTDLGARVVLSESGWYAINVSGGTVTVESHGGTALIYGPGKPVGFSVTPGNGSEYTIATDVLRALPPLNNLLQNSEFDDVCDDSACEIAVPAAWVCSHTIVPPRDEFVVEQQDGRNVLRLSRGDGATNAGETKCTQGLPEGQTWRDISTANQLRIRMSMYLNFQSLAVCGFAGTECPILVRLDYIDAQGDPGFLLYGFFATPGPSDPYDPTCPNCRLPHTRVQEKTWYTFDSGNILAGFPINQRPVAISRLQFYSSGHQYDVRVGRVELLTDG